MGIVGYGSARLAPLAWCLAAVPLLAAAGTLGCHPADPGAVDCRDGSCPPSCRDECAAGQTGCVGNGVVACDDRDGDGCREWSEPTPCPVLHECVNGECRLGQLCDDGTCDLLIDVLYVSLAGDDSWSGTLPEPNADGLDGPLASLAGARDAIRALKAGGAFSRPVFVVFRQGRYHIDAPVELSPEDSGTATTPITYASHPGETATLSGGRAVAWVQSGGTWSALVPEAAASAGVGALWIDGVRRTRARTPNTGYFYTAGPAYPPDQAFAFNPGDIQEWTNLQDAVVVVHHSWATSLHHIASVDSTQGIVTFTGAATWPFDAWGWPLPYRVENVPEALDEPGEWYLDRGAGVLSYLPLAGEDPTQTETIVPLATQLLVLRGDPLADRLVEHVTFRNLRFEHTDWQPGPGGFSSPQAAVDAPAAIEAIGARNVRFEGCFIGHVGAYGLWWRRGSRDVAVVQTELADLGAGGVRIGETEPPSTPQEAVRGVRVDNCFIHDGGTVLADGVGVWVGQSGYNEITHNEICDFGYSGVSVGWSWGYAPTDAVGNLVRDNYIHHLGRGVLSDLGGIYTLGVSPGTEVVHNKIHDVSAYLYGGWGLYADEGTSDVLFSDNLVYGTASGGFHQNYGAGNLVSNNIFAFSERGQLFRSTAEAHPSFDFRHNIVLFNNHWLLAYNWADGAFTMDENLYWDTSGRPVTFACSTLAEWQATGHDVGSLFVDPQFVDAVGYDFTLRATTPALGIGFSPFDLESFGLYGDPEWAARPRRLSRPPTPLPSGDVTPIADDFEATGVGLPPAGAVVVGTGGGAEVSVTDAHARSGTHGVKIEDPSGAATPGFFYRPYFGTGVVRAEFSVRLAAGASMLHEWRCWQAEPPRPGPQLVFGADGTLAASGVVLPVSVPPEEWVAISVRHEMGPAAGGLYDVSVEVPGQAPQVFAGLGAPGPGLCSLDWIGFSAMAPSSGALHLDDVTIRAE